MIFKQKIIRKKIFFFATAIAVAIVVADRLSKDMIIAALASNSPTANGDYGKFDISRLLSIVLVWNRGGSFGVFANVRFIPAFLLVSALLTSALLIFLLWNSQSIGDGLYMSLILGGALGNALDRILYGAVVDFIDIHLGQYHWPSFNLADSSIFCGAVLYLINDCLLTRKKRRNNSIPN
ncbi:MAG: signal peptidase II [Rickettsiales bacterium]|jgi:signal peptidase II|nr:signal peptidase II [Rickettsiales bacterium]